MWTRYAPQCCSLGQSVRVDAWVVLPDHMYFVVTLPVGDDDFSNRIKAIKIRFVRALPPIERRSPSRVARGERGIWRRRFWEHAIRDDTDYARHIDYVHYNPVKHGHVQGVAQWPYSTFHRWVRAGVYRLDWGGEAAEEVRAGERSG